MTNVLTKNIAGREMKVESGRVGMLSDAANAEMKAHTSDH